MYRAGLAILHHVLRSATPQKHSSDQNLRRNPTVEVQWSQTPEDEVATLLLPPSSMLKL